MTLPSPETVKKEVEEGAGFAEWLAEVLLGKNLVKKLTLLAGLLFGLGKFAPWVPKWYWLIPFSVSGLALIAALVVAIRKRRKPEPMVHGLSERSSIKGLISFGFGDADLFARLQRENRIQECLQAITDRSFRFGVLTGDSGSGKSSLLQAGLWPRLLQQQHRCVYVKFSDLAPLEAIRQAFREQQAIPSDSAPDSDLITLLRSASQADARPLVLLFDQFEQFFAHRKLKQDREPFLRAMADWYVGQAELGIKVLVCIRGDFSDRLIELQRAMGYALGPQQNFRIEKFEPEEATEILSVIAEKEGLLFDRDFVAELARQELASREDGLVSPVDIQVLAWMLVAQRSQADRALNRNAYRRLGGTEGLLERFLQRALQARETEGRRQAAIKMLLALTDLERNTRAGALSLEDLRKALAGTVAAPEIRDTVVWLARSDVRLIVPVKREGVEGFELAHERLIPALRRIAGKELTVVDQANQLLDRRVNEWLGNQRARRYLLRWPEWRQIERQRPFLVWGSQQRHKEELLQLSKRHSMRRPAWLVVPALALTGIWLWWSSDAGQIYQIKRELVTLSANTGMAPVLAEAAQALAISGELPQARAIANRIEDPSTKAIALSYFAKVLIRTGNQTQARALLEDAMRIPVRRDGSSIPAFCAFAEAWSGIERKGALENLAEAQRAAKEMPSNQTRALGLIAAAAAKIGDAGKAAALLEEAQRQAEAGDPRLSAFDNLENRIALDVAAASLGVLLKEPKFLEQALRLSGQATGGRKDLIFSAFVRSASELAAITKDRKLLEQAFPVAQKISYPPDAQAIAFARLAAAWAKIGEPRQASILVAQARQAASRIEPRKDWFHFKVKALSAIAESCAQMRDSAQASHLLAEAYELAVKTTDQFAIRNRAAGTQELGPVAARLGHLRLARQVSALSTSDEEKLILLSGILKAWALRPSSVLARYTDYLSDPV